MLLACYANGMVRLWNMLDARCIYKFKAGMSTTADELEEDEKDGDEEEDAVEEAGDKMERQNCLPDDDDDGDDDDGR